MKREIEMFPSKVLRTKTAKITMVDEELLEEIKDLKEMLEASENGAGLAAPQIGISKSFLGIKEGEKVKILINPRLEAFFGEKVYPKIVDNEGNESDFLEGCLSFPDLYGTVKRYLKIKVSWDEIKNKKPTTAGRLETRNEILEGFGAIVWQHEVDHLDGVLFVDHIRREGGKFYTWVGKKKVAADVNATLGREK